VLLSAIMVLPWVYPGRQMPGHVVAICAATIALAFAASRLTVTGFAWKAIRWPLVLLACAIGLGAWQLTTVAADCSPAAAAWKSEFAASPDSLAPKSALSYYVPGTRRQVASLVCAIAAVALGATLFAETKAMILLSVAIAGTGVVIACAGLVERAEGRIGSYFPSPLPVNAAPFGPFLNRNAAGALMELGLAAAAGLAVWLVSRIPRRSVDTSRIDRFRWFLMHVDLPLLLSVGALVIITAGIVSSLSRGSLLAALVGSIAALAVSGRRTNRHSFFWLALIVAASAAAMGIWLVQTSTLERRWSSILAGHILQEGRWELWRESLQAAGKALPFGSGLGTFYYAHAPFEQAFTLGLYRNADSQYVEAVVVGGVCGALILAALCCVMVRAVMRMWLQAQSPEHIGLAAGATAMVAMQLVHACFDFAWYLSPIMFPLALWSGAIFRKAAGKRTIHKSKADSSLLASIKSVPSESVRAATVCGAALTAVLLPALCWAGYETARSAIVEQVELDTRNHGEVERETEVIDDAIKRQTLAIVAYPDDGEAHLRMAELYVERYASEMRRAIDRDPIMRLAGDRYLPLQFPAVLNSMANLRMRVGDEEGVKELRELPIVKENLLPALAEVRRARELCPFSPFAQTLTAELCFIDEPASNDAWYLERAEKLSQGRPNWLFRIGQLHLNGARPNQVWPLWKRAWSMSGLNEDSMMQQGMAYLNPEEMLEQLIPNDPRKIVEMANKNYPEPDYRDARRIYFRKAARLLDAENKHSAEDQYVRGTAYTCDGRLDDAETALIAAIHSIAAKPEWHLELAVVQAALGHRTEADASAGRYRARSKDIALAGGYLRRAADLLRNTPGTDGTMLRRQAALYLESGAGTEAAEAARKAIATDANDIEAQVILARSLLSTGELKEAAEIVKRTEEQAPWRADVRDVREAINAAAKRAEVAP